MLRIILTLTTILGLLTACGESSEEGTGGGGGAAVSDIAADACEHLGEGPFNPLVAGADNASAPDATASHTSHDITLIDDGAGSHEGIVSIAIAEAAELLLFVDAEVAFSLFDSSGVALDVELSPGCPGADCLPGCPLVKNHIAVDVDQVGTYYVSFWPTPEAEVSLVHFTAAGHD